MIQLALFQPEIPQNTGTLIRLCACFDIKLHIIEPCGFLWNHKKMSRSAMDYFSFCEIEHHLSEEHFFHAMNLGHYRVIAMDTKASSSVWAFSFQERDVILMGRESDGLPHSVHQRVSDYLHIPQKNGRSLNMAIAASITLGEGIRQLSSFK